MQYYFLSKNTPYFLQYIASKNNLYMNIEENTKKLNQ